MRILNQIDSKPVAIVHNGNTSVTAQLSHPHALNILNIPGQTNLEKAKFLLQSNNVCNLSITDIDHKSLYNLSQYFYLVKVITSYDSDIQNLEDNWHSEHYTQQQYLTNLCFGISLCDKIVFLDSINDIGTANNKNYLLTPGRTGRRLLDKPEFHKKFEIVHHNQDDDWKTKLYDICSAKSLVTVMPKILSNQTTSMFMKEILGVYMNTTKETLEKNINLVNNSIPKKMPIIFAESIFLSNIDFYNWHIMLTEVLEKHVEFFYQEDIPYTSNIWMKNPYNKQDLIINYNEITLYIDTYLQPKYKKILTKKREIL